MELSVSILEQISTSLSCWGRSNNTYFLRIQFCVHIKPSTVLGVKELLKESRILPHVLNADFEDTIDTRMAKTSWTIFDKTLYLNSFAFHPAKTSKLSSSSSLGPDNYRSTSFLTQVNFIILFFGCILIILILNHSNSLR